MLLLYDSDADAILPFSEAEAERAGAGSDAAEDAMFLVDAPDADAALLLARAWMRARAPGAHADDLMLSEVHNTGDAARPTIVVRATPVTPAGDRHRRRAAPAPPSPRCGQRPAPG